MVEFSISSDQDVLSKSLVEVLHGKTPRGRRELCNILYDLRDHRKRYEMQNVCNALYQIQGSFWPHRASRTCTQSHLKQFKRI